MNVDQAAASLGRTTSLVRGQLQCGALRGTKVGTRWDIAPEDLNAYRRERLGNRHRTFTAEAIERRNEALRTDEVRAKMRAAKVGRKQTPEHVAHAAATRFGRRHTAESRAKMSAVQLGKTLAPDHLAALRKYHRGRRGKPLPIATRRRLAESLARAYAEGRRSYSTLEDRAADLLLPLGFERNVVVEHHVFDFGSPDGALLVEVNGCAWHDHRSLKPECPVKTRRDSHSKDEERRAIARLHDRTLVELWACEEASWPMAIALMA